MMVRMHTVVYLLRGQVVLSEFVMHSTTYTWYQRVALSFKQPVNMSMAVLSLLMGGCHPQCFQI